MKYAPAVSDAEGEWQKIHWNKGLLIKTSRAEARLVHSSLKSRDKAHLAILNLAIDSKLRLRQGLRQMTP
jgi:hypothetical protein